MKSESRVTVTWTFLAGAALVLLLLGAGAAYVVMRSPAPSPSPSVDSGSSPPAPPPTTHDIFVPLSSAAAERAGITVITVGAGTASSGLRAPGTVEANAYQQVVVTPLVSGRITRVGAELGQPVKRGQTIAEIFSPELADAETRYISARAGLDAHERELARTEKLVEIGAASKQELERIHAEHTARRAEMQSLSSRLQLLGMSTAAIESLGPGQAVEGTTSVPSPIDGVITKRDANIGANVDQQTALFSIVDLSTVWVVADVYERDFARVRVGSVATITADAYPGLALHGRVSYIDPQVNAASRTSKARVEVPNPKGDLRLGMFTEVRFDIEDGHADLMIPRSAVQQVGDRTVVYLARPNEAGRFIEREVKLGSPSGNQVSVLSGLEPGDVVVDKGSFYLRAERERLGLGAVVVKD